MAAKKKIEKCKIHLQTNKLEALQQNQKQQIQNTSVVTFKQDRVSPH